LPNLRFLAFAILTMIHLFIAESKYERNFRLQLAISPFTNWRCWFRRGLYNESWCNGAYSL